MSSSLVVLAAGIGSRYGGLKQMDPVGPSGEFIIDYSVFDALRAGFSSVVFVIRRDIEQEFRATIGARLERRADVRYVFQELSDVPAGFRVPAERKKPWGTGHAVLAAAGAVSGSFGVINADDFYGAESYRVLAEHLARPAASPPDYAMVGYRLANTLSSHGHVARGVCRSAPDGTLAEIEELTKIERAADGAIACEGRRLTGDERVSMNLWGFRPEFFEQLRGLFGAFLEGRGADPKAEFYIPEAVSAVIHTREATVRMLETSSRWMGVTYAQEKPGVVQAIRQLVSDGAYPARLWE